MTSFFWLLGLLGVGILPHADDYVRAQELTIIVIAMSAFSIYIGKRFGAAVALLYWWISIRAIVFFANPVSPVLAKGMSTVVCFDSLSSKAFLMMSLVAILVCLFPKKAIVPSLKTLMMVNSIAVILRAIFGAGPFYMMDNPSMDGTLIAMLWGVSNLRPELLSWSFKMPKGFRANLAPFIVDYSIVMLPLIAIVLTKSSMAYGTLAALFLAYALARPGYRMLLSALAALVLTVGYINLGTAFTDDSGRVQTWKETWTYFDKGVMVNIGPKDKPSLQYQPQVDVLRGAGTGTYWVHSDWIAHVNNRNNHPVFNTLHNDPGEILFEDGWIGLVLLALTCLTALWKSLDKPWLFASIAAICALSFGQMFLRLPLTALCIGLVFKLALSRKEKSA